METTLKKDGEYACIRCDLILTFNEVIQIPSNDNEEIFYFCRDCAKEKTLIPEGNPSLHAPRGSYKPS